MNWIQLLAVFVGSFVGTGVGLAIGLGIVTWLWKRRKR